MITASGEHLAGHQEWLSGAAIRMPNKGWPLFRCMVAGLIGPVVEIGMRWSTIGLAGVG
jgi:hypothetical protein